ncbi:MAG: hypothetical protein ACTSQO_07635 [Candidatus Helarchaeota archaeon]
MTPSVSLALIRHSSNICIASETGTASFVITDSTYWLMLSEPRSIPEKLAVFR